MRFDSRMVVAAPSTLPVPILRMKVGTSMPVGQARMQGASKQYRQRSASTTASCGVNGGFVSLNRSRNWSRVSSVSRIGLLAPESVHRVRVPRTSRPAPQGATSSP